LEELLTELIKEYGYIILFLWAILEGELGLIMAGLLTHSGDMNLYIAIFVAGCGGFTGDQIYFYIGRLNKNYIRKKLKSQKRKFALAKLLLDKYGWPIIFVQRYMYGLRTIIPMSIGTTDFSYKKFIFINFLSALVWASMTIYPVYYFGEEILAFIEYLKEYWYIALVFGAIFLVSMYIYFDRATDNALRKAKRKNNKTK
jgi:membrane protein DedA with SNARE-associated domain